MAQRIIYPVHAGFVGPSPSTGEQPSGSIVQLHRLTTFNFDYQKTLQDVTVMGTYAPIDRVALQLATVSSDFGYYLTNVHNESGIGLNTNGTSSALSGILNDTQRDKNYFMLVVPEGRSAVGYSSNDCGVISIGNAVLASYRAQGTVGDFATANFTLQALDLNFTTGRLGFESPALNPSNGQQITGYTVSLPVATSGDVGQATAIQPGDITVSINGAGLGLDEIYIQSFDVGFDLGLEDINALGAKYALSREIQFPVNCTMSVEANLRDLGTGRLSDSNCVDTKYDCSVTLRAPSCDGNGPVKAVFTLKGAILANQTYSASIGPSMSTTLNFEAPIGGPDETAVGLFVSGSLS